MHREVILKVRRTIFPHDVTMHASSAPSSFLTWMQSCFSGRSSAGSPAGSGRTTPATWSTPRRGACSVPRDHPTPAPDSPARRRAAEVKMVGYITTAHDIAQRLSEKWRHFVVHCLYSLFCTSPRCVGVAARRVACARAVLLCGLGCCCGGGVCAATVTAAGARGVEAARMAAAWCARWVLWRGEVGFLL